MTKIEYSDKVLGYLHRMKFGVSEIDGISSDVIPTAIAKGFFLEIVKDFISNDNGRQAGFYIELNSAFNRIRKVEYWNGKKEAEITDDDRTSEIAELKTFFSTATLPEKIKLVGHEEWTDVRKAVNSHLSYLEHGKWSGSKLAYLQRLIDLKKIIEKT